jgi:hypothetical protein
MLMFDFELASGKGIPALDAQRVLTLNRNGE